MVKMSVFDKTNYVSVISALRNVFQRRSSEVLLPDVPYVWTVQKNMLH